MKSNHPLQTGFLPFLSAGILLFVVICPEAVLADSGTWDPVTTDANYNNAANWSSLTVPNGTGQVATFGPSLTTSLSLSAATEVDSLVFNSTANPYTITATGYTLTVSGAGITNNSGSTETLITQGTTVGSTAESGKLYFENSATVGTGTTIENEGGSSSSYTFFHNTSSAGSATIENFGGTSASGKDNGYTEFTDSSTAAKATITNMAATGGANALATPGLIEFFATSTAGQATVINDGATIANGYYGGQTEFYATSTAGTATFTNNGSSVSPSSAHLNAGATYFFANSSADHSTIINNASLTSAGYGGEAIFGNNSLAGSATITNNGATYNSGSGGTTEFQDASSAGNATVVAAGGSNGGGGGSIYFEESSSGGTSHIDVEGNGLLDISDDAEDSVSIGSLQGSGAVYLGQDMLSIGSDNSSTTFSGVMQDSGYAGGTGGSLTKNGTGKVILTGANTYTGATTIAAGTLQVDGSVTSAPTIEGGATLSGHGSVGSVTLMSGGFVAPGGPSGGTLQVTSLLWDSGGQLQFTLGGATPDLLKFSGGFDSDSTSNGTYTFDFTNAGVKVGETFDLVEGGTTATTNFDVPEFSYNSAGQFTGYFGFSTTDNALTFTVSTVAAPEPTSMTLFLSALALLVIIRSGGCLREQLGRHEIGVARRTQILG